MKTKGFTLVELLVVIAILAILATVSVVGYTSFIDRAEQSNAETEAHQVESAIESVLMIPGEVYDINGTHFIAKVESKYVVATRSGTAGNYTYTEVADKTDLTASFRANSDFGELCGTTGNGIFVWDATNDLLYYVPEGQTTVAIPTTGTYVAINFNN